mgnify:CR=1 FL=1
MADKELIDIYRKTDKELALFYYKLNSEKDYETSLFVPDISVKGSIEAQLGELKAKTEKLETPDKVFEILKRHFMDFISGLELFVSNSYERPAEYVNIFLNTFRVGSRIDMRPDDVRAEVILNRFSQADEVWKGILTWIDKVSELYLRELADVCKLCINTMCAEKAKLRVYFPSLNEMQYNRLSDTMDYLSVKMSRWMEYAKNLMFQKGMSGIAETKDSDIVKFDEQYYRTLLNHRYGVNLDELISWHDEEVEKTRNEVLEIAGKLKIAEPVPKTMKEVNSVLFKYAGPCPTPEEMFRRADSYIKRTRAVCHEFIRMPDDETCIINETPEQFKFSWPWGGYGGLWPRKGPLRGEMFLNKFNYQAVTDGWIKMNTVHEAYPGHHAQFVRATLDPIPETMKIGAKYIPIMEGTAHRSERAFEFIFAEDQFYPLFVAYRRHHTSVRIKADLWMRYFGKPIGSAVKLYMDELDFDRETARGQVKAQEEQQGYYTNYYYGMKKISDWEIKYNYDKKQFTELLFSVGKISLDNFEKFLKLNDGDKYRLTHDFGSLLQFD